MKRWLSDRGAIGPLVLEIAGLLIPVIVLLVYRTLFFQESLLKAVQVVVPLEDHRTLVFWCLMLLAVLIFGCGLWMTYGSYRDRKFRIACTNPYLSWIWIVVCLANAVLSFFEIELINNYYLLSMEQQYVLLGIGITFVIYVIFVLLIGSVSIAMVIGNWFFLLWGIVNFYVQRFRGIPFQWIDLGAIGTAMSVSGNYDYTPSWQVIAGIVLTLIVSSVYLHLRFWHNFSGLWGRLISRGVSLIILFSFIGVIFHTSFLQDQGIWLRDWQPWYTYRLFGMESGFLAFAKASYPTAPESYSTGEVKKIISETEPKSSTGNEAAVPENIICIMNESFSDLTIYPNFSQTEDVMPFLNAMKGAENTQQGRLMVSVKGGTTANTEYEFLTGNSDVLSPSTVVYNSFIKDDQYSLARTLKAQGYTAYALHPYGKNGWNRSVVYPRMGFDEFYSTDNYFQSAPKLRNYISDEGDYEALIQQVEEKKPGEKLFLFNVTMQNHGAYTSPLLERRSALIGYTGKDEDRLKAEQYLTLVRYSDEALEKLVDYFSKSDEKTLIVFWGDHQPEIGDDFWQYCLGHSAETSTFEEQQLMYETRYFIWANYDLPELEDQTLSANYLSSYVLSLTGLTHTGYNDFLLQQRELIPAMNAYGYLGTDGLQHEWNTDEAGEAETEQVEKYKCLIYNELTAGRRRDETFFGGA